LKNVRVACCVLLAIIVAACTRTDNTPVTHYKPAESGSVADSIFAGGIATHGSIENAVSGYTSRQIGPGHFEVKASGTTATPSRHVEAIAHLRAAEIAQTNGSLAFHISKEKSGVECARKGGALIGARPFTQIEIQLLQSDDQVANSKSHMAVQEARDQAREILASTDSSDEAKAKTGQTNMGRCRT